MSTPQGTVVVEDNRAAICFERRYPHPVEVVWTALTEPSELAEWLGHAHIEGRVGGSVLIEAGPAHIPVEHRRVTGRVLVWDPPRVLEYEWRQKIVEESTLRFELEPDGAGTILRLTHRWLSVPNAGGFIPGWHAYLDRLDALLGGTAVPDWSARYGELRPLYAENQTWTPNQA